MSILQKFDDPMTMKIDATLTGIHSRSEPTVKITRDFDRGRTNKEVLDSAFKSDAIDLVKLELESGLTKISDGQLLWQDFIRPFSESITGLKFGADLSRWFDTNSFYRKPTVVSQLSAPNDSTFLLVYSVGAALDLIEPNKNRARKISLIGPYTLASLVSNNYYKSKERLVHDFARMLRKVLQYLPKIGITSVQFNEPSLVYRYGESALTSKKELRIFMSAFDKYLSKLPLEVNLHTYFGDSSRILKELLTLEGISSVGIDFTQTSLKSVENVRFKEKALACGCVDGRNSLIESPEWIADFCAEAVRMLKPNGLVILPSSELKYLPRACADGKIRSIGKARNILEARLK